MMSLGAISREVASAISPFLAAKYVGRRASWWMGLTIGILVGAAGFVQRDAARATTRECSSGRGGRKS